MKIIANFNDMYYTEDQEVIVSFKTNNFQSKARFKEMDKDVAYSIEFKPVKSKRTLDQNNYFWTLIGELAKSINGDNDVDSIYSNILERFGVKFATIPVLEVAVDEFIKLSEFRFIRKVAPLELDDRKFIVLQCFYGSSKYTKKEMMHLIDGALHMASECGLDLVYWRDVLYVKETKETKEN
jgi:hypothetical protein